MLPVLLYTCIRVLQLVNYGPKAIQCEFEGTGGLVSQMRHLVPGSLKKFNNADFPFACVANRAHVTNLTSFCVSLLRRPGLYATLLIPYFRRPASPPLLTPSLKCH